MEISKLSSILPLCPLGLADRTSLSVSEPLQTTRLFLLLVSLLVLISTEAIKQDCISIRVPSTTCNHKRQKQLSFKPGGKMHEQSISPIH